jgi:uncharacterized protein (TIGR02145 family)
LTLALSSITQTTAISGGNVTSDGGTTVSERGVCWGTSTNPTIADNHTSDGTGTGFFSSNLTELNLNTTYFVRAYIINSTGTTYGNEIFFATKGEIGTLSDIDGNTYSTVVIGTQTWMAENLKTTKYNNGDLIGTTTPATLDISSELTPKYQWAYDGNEINVATYGRLYTGYAITGIRNVCPSGWHVPSDPEWTTLANYLGGESVAGYKLREASTIYWIDNIGVTNETGFAALPGGERDISGNFDSIRNIGIWWSSTEDNEGNLWFRYMFSDSGNVADAASSLAAGFSVRCLKD